MDLDDSQDDPAKRSLHDLSMAFARGSEPIDASPVKEKLAKMRKLIDEKEGNQTASSSADGMEKSILDAISALSKKMDGMALKADLDDMNAKIDKMASKSDIDTMKSEISQEIKVTVAQAVDPLKAELHDLKIDLQDVKQRVDVVESKPPTVSASASKDVAELQRLVQEFDPSNKRISFVGWPKNTSAADRRRQIDAFIAKFPGHRCVVSGNFYSGPYSDRKLSRASYAEFGSPEEACEAFNSMKDADLKSQGSSITIKMARSKLNGRRNFSIRKAEELVKAHLAAQGKEIKIVWKTDEPGQRHVTVGGDIAFTQGKHDVRGFFSAPFSDIQLL